MLRNITAIVIVLRTLVEILDKDKSTAYTQVNNSRSFITFYGMFSLKSYQKFSYQHMQRTRVVVYCIVRNSLRG